MGAGSGGVINPNGIADAVVDTLRDIPELVEAMGDDLANISAYHGIWPDENDLMLAVQKMQPPAILVAPRGFYEGALGTLSANKYPLSLFLRPRTGESGESLAALILGGVPTAGGGIKFRFLKIHPQCYEMTDSPRLQKTAIPVGENSLLEIPELQLILTENGDN